MFQVFAAVLEGDTQKVLACLSDGTDVNAVCHDGWPSIIRKRISSDVPLEFLTTYTSSHRFTERYAWTPLLVASAIGNSELVDCLIQFGADINYQDNTGLSALMLASALGHGEIVERLLDHGANLELSDEDGNTALIYAVSRGCPTGTPPVEENVQHLNHLQIAESLLLRGANVSVRGSDGASPLTLAAFYGPKSLVLTILSKGADPFEEDDFIGDSICAAILGRNEDILKLFLTTLDLPPSKQSDYLCAAIFANDERILSALLQAGMDPNVEVSACSEVPLMFAAARGRTIAIQVLLDGGADPNRCDKSGMTAIDFAQVSGHADAAKLLAKSR